MKHWTLWDFRIRHNLTLPALAQMLGVHKSQISRWETNKRPIPPWVEKFLACIDKTTATKVPESGKVEPK